MKIRVFVSISNRLKFFIHFQHINIEESDRTAATAVVTITPTPEHNEIRVDFHLTTTLSCQPAEAEAVAVADGQQYRNEEGCRRDDDDETRKWAQLSSCDSASEFP